MSQLSPTTGPSDGETWIARGFERSISGFSSSSRTNACLVPETIRATAIPSISISPQVYLNPRDSMSIWRCQGLIAGLLVDDGDCDLRGQSRDLGSRYMHLDELVTKGSEHVVSSEGEETGELRGTYLEVVSIILEGLR